MSAASSLLLPTGGSERTAHPPSAGGPSGSEPIGRVGGNSPARSLSAAGGEEFSASSAGGSIASGSAPSGGEPIGR
eukprot:7426238-Alexandrium_andersonii.AAC.1